MNWRHWAAISLGIAAVAVAGLTHVGPLEQPAAYAEGFLTALSCAFLWHS